MLSPAADRVQQDKRLVLFVPDFAQLRDGEHENKFPQRVALSPGVDDKRACRVQIFDRIPKPTCGDPLP